MRGSFGLGAPLIRLSRSCCVLMFAANDLPNTGHNKSKVRSSKKRSGKKRRNIRKYVGKKRPTKAIKKRQASVCGASDFD